MPVECWCVRGNVQENTENKLTAQEIVMEEVERARRKALQASVATLCVEVGYMGIEKDALGVLSEIVQSCK